MKEVKIGQQIWSQEDLKVTKFRNGEDIPLVEDGNEWSEQTTAAYCITPKGNYLYNWYAVNDPRGLAPEGWHVPSDEEWATLITHLGGESVAGGKLKSSAADSPSWDGSNASGFSALPGGLRYYYDGNFTNGGYNGYWWSASPDGTSYAWYRKLYSDDDDVIRYYLDQRYGFSVRCIKD